MNLIKKLYCGILTLSLATCSTTTILATDDSEIILSSTNVEVAAGNSFSAVLKSNGTVWTWGLNNKGQLGDGTLTNNHISEPIANFTDIEHIAAGKEHMLALKDDGTVWAWGNNNYGQLGNNTTSVSSTPVQVKVSDNDYLTNIVAIDAGESHSIALKDDGTVWVWGCNTNGRLGNGTQSHSSLAIQVPDLSSITKISAGGKHNVVLKNDGTLLTWGYNGYGQLGNNATTNSYVPIAVSGLTDIISIDSGANHNIALNQNGKVYGWGRNDYGQIGANNFTSRIKEPTLTFNGANMVSAGENVSFVRTTTGVIGGTGYNYYGQLGIDNFYQVKLSSFHITNISDIMKLTVGTKHTMAIKENGDVWGWGDNSNNAIDNTYSEKKGLPRIIRNKVNDMVGNTVLSSYEITDASKTKSRIDYSNDIDVFSFTAPKSGKLFITINAEKDVSLSKFNVNAFDDVITNQKLITYEMNVTENSEYHFAISGINVCNYTLGCDILENEEILAATISSNQEDIVIAGSANNSGDSILVNIYNPENKLVNIVHTQASANGNYTLSYSKALCQSQGKYQFVVCSNGTRNTVVLDYLVGESAENKAIARTTTAYGNVSVAQTTLSVANLGKETITQNLYFNTAVTNLGTTTQNISVMMLQTDSNDYLKDLLVSTIPVKSLDTVNFKVGKKLNGLLPEDNYYTIVCDADSGILLSNINNIQVFSNQSSSAEARLFSNNEYDLLSSINNLPIDTEIQAIANKLQDVQSGSLNIEQNISTVNDCPTLLSGDDAPTLMSIPTYEQPNAVMNAQYDGEYYEGLLQYGELNIESKVYNPTDSEIPATLIVPSYKMINGIDELVELQKHSTEIAPYFNEVLMFSRTINDEYYNSCDIFRVFTWKSLESLIPYGNVLTFQKETHYNNWTTNQRYSPEVNRETVIHGVIHNNEAYDVLTFIPDFDGSVNLFCDPIIGDELSIRILNENSVAISQNEESFDVEADKVYYILITGAVNTEYLLSIN